MTTIADVRDEIVTAISRSDSNSEVLTSVQRAVEFISDLRGGMWRWLEGNKVFTTTSGTEEYDIVSAIGISDLKNIRMLRYENTTLNNTWPVLRKSERVFKDTWWLEGTSSGEPQEYYEDAGSIFIGPTPDDSYNIRFRYRIQHAITEGTTILMPRGILKSKAFSIFWTDYREMPELAVAHEIQFNLQLLNLIALEPREDEVNVVAYRDF